jgi:hypothetical protein
MTATEGNKSEILPRLTFTVALLTLLNTVYMSVKQREADAQKLKLESATQVIASAKGSGFDEFREPAMKVMREHFSLMNREGLLLQLPTKPSEFPSPYDIPAGWAKIPKPVASNP